MVMIILPFPQLPNLKIAAAADVKSLLMDGLLRMEEEVLLLLLLLVISSIL